MAIPLTVLVVDDDTWMTRVLNKIFMNLNIEKVFATNDGFNAIAIALKERPDVIFLDLMMPELDGMQTLKMIRTIPDIAGTKTIICSANNDVNSFAKTISLGATDYISKPFTLETIKEKLVKLYQPLFEKEEERNKTK